VRPLAQQVVEEIGGGSALAHGSLLAKIQVQCASALRAHDSEVVPENRTGS
jgi:hypothetical protein